jgi:Xaa-Pro dipeptidase
MTADRCFPEVEFKDRLQRLRARMRARGLDGCLVSAPENIYYLTGLEYQGFFACTLLVVPLDGQPILITRAMERTTVRDMLADIRHVVFHDGIDPLPPAEDVAHDIMLSGQTASGNTAGLKPWSMSLGVPTRPPGIAPVDETNPAQVTVEALRSAGLESACLGIEKSSTFLPFAIAEEIVLRTPRAKWEDASTLVGDCRLIQSDLELQYTRKAAEIADAMMMAGIAAAGPGVFKRDVVAAIYQMMFSRGGTYPGFVPLVRSTRTIEHEHRTWDNRRLSRKDLLFLEMGGCYFRYHAPIGRLIYIGKQPARASRIHQICREALEAAVAAMAPGTAAGDVFRAWKRAVDKAGLRHYTRHHCGYAVGIGFPPSWTGSGVPLGLRSDSKMELKPGMVFHVMSWLIRTGRGDSFLSDTVVVTPAGCEVLTRTSRDLQVR